MRASIAVAVFCVASLAGASAGADTREKQARESFRLGTELFDSGKFEQAAIAFARAYELKPSYRILFNIAQSENELGHYAAALKAYVRYLLEGGDRIDEERTAQVNEEIERLNALVGSIIISCEIEGATVMIDGEIRGETPLAEQIFVDLGRHEVVVKHGGERLHRQVVKVAGGQKVKVNVEVGGAVGDREPDDAGSKGEQPDDDDRGLAPAAFYTSLGLTGALGITTLALEIGVQSKIDEVENDPSNKKAVDSGKSLQTAERVVLGITAAGVVATAVIAIFTDFEEASEDDPEVVVSPSAGSTGAGIAVQGKF